MNTPINFTIDQIINTLGWLVALITLILTIARDSKSRQKDHDEQIQKTEHLFAEMSTLTKSVNKIQFTLDKINDHINNDKNNIVKLNEQNKTLFTRLEILEHRLENHLNGKD